MRYCGPVWALALAVLSGCGDGPLSPAEQRQLAAARERWAQQGAPDYTVESRILCFCPPHLAVWTRLTVHGGVVVAAEPVEPAPAWVASSLLGWHDVEELFEIIGSDQGDYIRELTAAYDAVFGYPREISLTCHSNVTDCGVRYEMRNLSIGIGSAGQEWGADSLYRTPAARATAPW